MEEETEAVDAEGDHTAQTGAAIATVKETGATEPAQKTDPANPATSESDPTAATNDPDSATSATGTSATDIEPAEDGEDAEPSADPAPDQVEDDISKADIAAVRDLLWIEEMGIPTATDDETNTETGQSAPTGDTNKEDSQDAAVVPSTVEVGCGESKVEVTRDLPL